MRNEDNNLSMRFRLESAINRYIRDAELIEF